MRFNELLEHAPKNMNKKDAFDILKDIETGRGRITEIVKKKPYLQKLSQNYLKENFGNNFNVFRAVGVVNDLKIEHEVSVSLDWEIPFNIATNFPVLMSSDFINPKPILLRYKISTGNVIAYVPLLVDIAIGILGDSKKNITNKHGEKISVSQVIQTGKDEKELIVDVVGLSPIILEFDQSVVGKMWLNMIGDMVKGVYKNPRQYAEYLKSEWKWHPDDPQEFENEVKTRAIEIKKFLMD